MCCVEIQNSKMMIIYFLLFIEKSKEELVSAIQHLLFKFIKER